MIDSFIEITHREFRFFFRGTLYKTEVSDGEIETYVLTDDADEDSWYLLEEDDWENWIGALIFWYEDKDGEHGPACTWTETDYHRAAQMCQLAGYVLPARRLEQICEIKNNWGEDCADYETAKRNLDLFLKPKSETHCEGAD